MFGDPIRRAIASSPPFALGLCFAVWISPASAASYPPRILLLTDTVLIGQVWNLVHPDSARPTGEFQILLPSESATDAPDASSEAFLLRNGTETGSLDLAAWQAAAIEASARGDAWTDASEETDQREIPLLWKSLRWSRKQSLDWLEWPSGLMLAMGSSITSLPGSQSQSQRDIDFLWSQKLFKHYLLGAEVHRSQFGGGLTRAALMAQDAESASSGPVSLAPATRSFWGDAYWWWSVSAGVPGIKYTLALANQPLPAYYWLEPRAKTAITIHAPGRIVKQWTGSTLEKAGNFSHTLDARLGYLRYGLHFDSDAYRVAVHAFSIDDLPALFGTWGTGLVMASDVLATRIWVDIPDLGFTLPYPRAYPSGFRLAFLHMDFAYRSLHNFNLGFSVRIRIDNPILNLPGA